MSTKGQFVDRKLWSAAKGAPPARRRWPHWFTESGRKGVVQMSAAVSQGVPERRSQPVLVEQWTFLWCNEFVELRYGTKSAGSGWVDDRTPDGSIIWIHLSSGIGRVMIHKDDGIDVWRVDARISHDRTEADTDSSYPYPPEELPDEPGRFDALTRPV